MSLFSNHEMPDQMADALGDLAHPEQEPGGEHFGYEPTEADWRDYDRWLRDRELAVSHVAGHLQGIAMRLRAGLETDVPGRLESLAAELLGR